MPERLPELVQALRLARDGASLRGEIRLSQMPRLAPLLSDIQGTARFELEFDIDAQSRPVIHGSIQASPRVICQRCLEPMTAGLDLGVNLGIVRSESEAVALPDELEPLLLKSETVALASLIEDELILGLPAVARHPPGGCRPPGEVEVGEAPAGSPRESPFARLADLKGKKRTRGS